MGGRDVGPMYDRGLDVVRKTGKKVPYITRVGLRASKGSGNDNSQGGK